MIIFRRSTNTPFEMCRLFAKFTVTPPHYRASAFGKPTPTLHRVPRHPFQSSHQSFSFPPRKKKRITKPSRPLCRTAFWMTCTALWAAPLASPAHRSMRIVLANTPRCPARICLLIGEGRRQLASAAPASDASPSLPSDKRKALIRTGLQPRTAALPGFNAHPCRPSTTALAACASATALMTMPPAVSQSLQKGHTIFVHIVDELLSLAIHQ